MAEQERNNMSLEARRFAGFFFGLSGGLALFSSYRNDLRAILASDGFRPD